MSWGDGWINLGGASGVSRPKDDALGLGDVGLGASSACGLGAGVATVPLETLRRLAPLTLFEKARATGRTKARERKRVVIERLFRGVHEN